MVSFGEDPRDSADLRQIKRIVVGALWASLAPSIFTTSFMFSVGAPWAGVTIASVGSVSLLIVVALRARPGLWPGIFHLLIGANNAAVIVMTLLFGGIAESGMNFIWGYAGILAATVVFRDRRVLYWLGVFAASLIATEIAASNISPRYELSEPAIGTIGNLIIVGTFTFLVLLYFIRQRDSLQRESDALLRNVLPDEIADRLLVSGDPIADQFDNASILFADLVGFTPMSARMSPTDTVDLLNEVFSVFDELVDERGLEKIKTVGDEYMVAAGVPRQRVDHAQALADLALAMRDYTASGEVRGHAISFRIGINSGPVVAGIIGTRKFSYDLWGDAVNTASRMESHGMPGEIQISAATYELIREEFACEPRGTIDVKGKGPVSVWYLRGRTETRGR